MQYTYNFNLKDVVNIDNYYDFLEVFLKENNILKKEFFKKTDICPNSYRFFLKNKEKNKYSYYKIISKKYDLYLPSDKELVELSNQFSKIIEDIFYKRNDKLDEDNEIIASVRKRSNPNNQVGIFSMEGILFELASCLLNISLGDQELKNQLDLLKQLFKSIMPYKELLKVEYELILYLLQIYYKGLNKENFNNELFITKEFGVKYHILQPLLDNIISDAYYVSQDYMNSVVFGLKAYDGFIQMANFQRAIHIKVNLANSYILTGSYFNAYQSLLQMYLSFNFLNESQKREVVKGIVESLILAGKYKDVYEFIQQNMEFFNQNERLIEYLIVLYKLNKKEEFDSLYNELENQWSNQQQLESYDIIIKNVQKIYSNPKLTIKKRDNLVVVINSLQDSNLVKICKSIFKIK